MCRHEQSLAASGRPGSPKPEQVNQVVLEKRPDQVAAAGHGDLCRRNPRAGQPAPAGGSTRNRVTADPTPVLLHHRTRPVENDAGHHEEPDEVARILRRRLDEVRANMQRTADGMKQLAESAP